jgi:hypothetical protein
MTQTKYLSRRFNMLSFLKKIFGSKPAESAPAPYKVETPKVSEFPFPSKPAQAKAKKKTAGPKPAVKAKSARKPKAPKA